MCDSRSSVNSFVSFTPAKHRHSAEQTVEHRSRQVLGGLQRIIVDSFMSWSLEPLPARAQHALRSWWIQEYCFQITVGVIYWNCDLHAQMRAWCWSTSIVSWGVGLGDIRVSMKHAGVNPTIKVIWVKPQNRGSQLPSLLSGDFVYFLAILIGNYWVQIDD